MANDSRHYVAIFAVFAIPGSRTDSHGTRADDYFDDIDCHSRRYVLLAFSPLDEEEDLSAQSMFDLISESRDRSLSTHGEALRSET